MWRIPRANSWDATSGRLLRRRQGQSEHHIRHQIRSRGGETLAYVRLPSHPAHQLRQADGGRGDRRCRRRQQVRHVGVSTTEAWQKRPHGHTLRR
ncbi:unnamed protein product [Sphacelaria rigidula]